MSKVNISAIEYRDVSSLIQYSKNAKLHPDEQIDQIANSIAEYSFLDPVAVDENNIILEGHGRLAAAKKMGMQQVPVIQIVGLSEAQKKGYRLASNKLVLNSGFDNEALVAELEALATVDFDLSLTGFSSEELDELLEMAGESEGEGDSEGNEDEVPDPEEVEPRCKLGEIWALGRHRLLVCSCIDKNMIEYLMEGNQADALFTDPPYGIGTSIANDDLSVNELIKFNHQWASIAPQFLKPDAHVVCFHSTRLFWTALEALKKAGFKFERYLTLYKPNDCTFPWHGWILKSESILLFTKGKPKYIEISPYQHDTLVHNHSTSEFAKESIAGHPCSKPLSFINEFIQRFSGDLFLDFFLGSGTTLIACEKTGRTCYGTEIDVRYATVILDRFQRFTGIEPKLVKTVPVA